MAACLGAITSCSITDAPSAEVQPAQPCDMVFDDDDEGADKEQLWDHVLATYQADCLNESLAAALRLKDLEAEQPQMRTYGYLILNYWKLDRIADGRSIYQESLKVFGPRPLAGQRKSENLDAGSLPTDAQPIPAPKTSVPAEALASGIAGMCDVRFDVDVEGSPKNIVAFCTHDSLKTLAEERIASSTFAPKIIGGEAVERKNVVYPIEFDFSRNTDPNLVD